MADNTKSNKKKRGLASASKSTRTRVARAGGHASKGGRKSEEQSDSNLMM